MRPDERLGLARLAYVRAIELARARSTPTSWGRILTAAKNLDAARRDRERERSRSLPRNPAGSTPEPVCRRAAPIREGPARTPPVQGSPSVKEGPGDRATLRRVQAPPANRWPELTRELDRSRALRREARRLMSEARALRTEIAGLVASWPAQLWRASEQMRASERMRASGRSMLGG